MYCSSEKDGADFPGKMNICDKKDGADFLGKMNICDKNDGADFNRDELAEQIQL